MDLFLNKIGLPLPNVRSNHASIHYPNYFKIIGESLLSVPKSVNVDGVIAYGGGTGAGSNIINKAYGEFFERNHFFNFMPVHTERKLKDIYPKQYRNKLLMLCDQNKFSQECCLEHTFAFTSVQNIFNDTPAEYFSASIALSGHNTDIKYLGFNDSCACASHPIKEWSLNNSLREFLERQAMVGSWLTKKYRYCINPEILFEITPYQEFVACLLENGVLHIFEIGNNLPGYSIMMFYFAESEEDLVQYSAGASSGLSLDAAINSAFTELFQCYCFIYNSENTRDLKDKAGVGYALDFQKCNTKEVRARIPFMEDSQSPYFNTLKDIKNLEKFSKALLLQQLSLISPDIFYYHCYDKSLGLHFTKILSPDFFSHMSLNHYLNLDHAYAKSLNITKENAFLGKIPFP